MTAPTFRVVRDGVPQVAGDFADMFAAMDYGRREYEDDVYEPMEDLDYITHLFSWVQGWDANGVRCLWLFDDQTRTGVHIDPVTVPLIDHTQVRIMPKAMPS